MLPTGATTVIALQDITTPSQAAISTPAYSIDFNVAANQGVIQGSVPSTIHAVPVAGVSGSDPTYLTGDFGSDKTTDPLASGNYLSTGTGTITITFTAPQTSLALLWGSIDSGNLITFNNGAGSLSGAQVQASTAGFSANGFQGPTGSAYVLANSDTPFTTVTLTSDVLSFEVAGLAGASGSTAVPEPLSLALLGTGLVATGLIRKRMRPQS